MYILFVPAALALLLALAMNIYPIFVFKQQKPMLEQIEHARAIASAERYQHRINETIIASYSLPIGD